MNVVFILNIIYPRTLTDLKAPFTGWEYISGAHHLFGVCKVMGFKTSTVETLDFFFSLLQVRRGWVFLLGLKYLLRSDSKWQSSSNPLGSSWWKSKYVSFLGIFLRTHAGIKDCKVLWKAAVFPRMTSSEHSLLLLNLSYSIRLYNLSTSKHQIMGPCHQFCHCQALNSGHNACLYPWLLIKSTVYISANNWIHKAHDVWAPVVILWDKGWFLEFLYDVELRGWRDISKRHGSLITGMSGFNSKSSCSKSSCIIEIKVNIILIFHFMLIWPIDIYFWGNKWKESKPLTFANLLKLKQIMD